MLVPSLCIPGENPSGLHYVSSLIDYPSDKPILLPAPIDEIMLERCFDLLLQYLPEDTSQCLSLIDDNPQKNDLYYLLPSYNGTAQNNFFICKLLDDLLLRSRFEGLMMERSKCMMKSSLAFQFIHEKLPK